MLFLFDTNAVSDYMNQHPRIQVRLAALGGGDEACTCTIVRGEIRFGIEQLPPGKRRSALEARAATALAAMNCEPVPEAAADSYARFKLSCRQSGIALDENDLWIAATANALGAVLVSRDRDFTRMPGLKLEDWTV